MSEDNATLTGSDALPANSLRDAVVDAAEAYVDALYSAKFARTMSRHANSAEVQASQHNAIAASRALVEVVGRWREAKEPKKLLVEP